MLIRQRYRKQHLQTGLSLIELMISIAIGLIILAASIAVYVLIFKGTVLALRSSQLNYDMDNLMLVVTHDIRRAGFWGGAVSGWDIDDTENPFTASGADISINTDWLGDGSNLHCVTYSYDFDGDGNFDNDSDGQADGDDVRELVGFRLNDNGSISMRVAGTAPGSCTEGTWEELTVTENSEQVTITDFDVSSSVLPADTTIDGAGPYPGQTAFSQCDNIDDAVSTADSSLDCTGLTNNTGDTLAVRRVINIRLTGQAGRDSEIYKSLSASVRLGNDALKPAP